MRALSLRIRRQISLRPRLWLAGTLAVLLLAVGGGAYLLANSYKPVAPLPRPTTADRWTMSELVSHIEQGSVLTVTVGLADGGGQMLVALNTDSQYVPVTLSGSVGDAAQALIAFGYRDLLTPTAITAADSRAAGANDSLRSVINLVLLGSL